MMMISFYHSHNVDHVLFSPTDDLNDNVNNTMIPLDQVAFGELGKRGLDNEDAGLLDSISISYF